MTATTSESEVRRTLDHLAAMPGIGHASVRLPVLRAIMLRTDGQIMARGRLWDITSERLAHGVYRVSTRESSS